MLQPLLPKLKGGTSNRVANFERPGIWRSRRAIELDDLSESLDVEKIDSRYVANIDCIPDMWARPLLFQMALFDSEHLLHKRIMSEWRGLLAMLALRNLRNLTLLDVERVDITPPDSTIEAQAPLDFVDILGRVIPTETLFPDTKWDKLYVIMFGDQPIGMTSPTTLVCTAADCSNRIHGVTWFIEPFLCDPVDKDNPCLNLQERQALAGWLDQLRNNLAQHGDVGNRRNTDISGSLFRLIGEFQRDLGGVPQVPVDLSSSGLRMSEGFFSYLDKPVKAREPNVEGSHVRLMPSREQTPDLSLLVVDREIPRQWKMHDAEVFVWGSATIDSYPFHGLGSQRTEYGGVALPRNLAQLRTPEDFFTEKLFVMRQQDAFPGTMRSDGADALKYQGEVVTPIIPINNELLSYLTADDLCRRISFEPRNEGIIVKLRLPLFGPDGNGADFEMEKEFSFHEGEVVPIPNVPLLEVWPNFSARNWKVYHTYFSTAEQTDTFYAEPYVLGDDSEVQTFQNYDGETERQVTRTSSFPEAMKCSIGNEEAGILLLAKPRPVPSQMGQREVGIDFGTTATNVYVYDEQQAPRPIQFRETHFLQVTACGEERWRLYDDFLPGLTESMPFLSIFHDFQTTDRSPLRPLLDGHIYFLRDYREFNATARGMATDLKWSGKPAVRTRTRTFLEQLCLQCAAETAADGVRGINWRFSFPTAFSNTDLDQFRLIWKNIAESCADLTGVVQSQDVPQDEPESIASARFFAERHDIRAAFSTGVVCIDIGGGTSDISIWQNNKLRWQTSLQFAGRHVFLNLLYENPSFLRIFNIDDNNLRNLENAIGNRGAFYAQADALITDQGQQWLDNLTDFAGTEEIKEFTQLIAIGLSGLFYYVGLLLQYLSRHSRYDAKRMPYVYIGGNGSRIFHWVANGEYNRRSSINALFKDVLLTASEFEASPEDFEITVSPDPKAEVAFGLVSRGTILTHEEAQLREAEVLTGEVFTKDGRECGWSEKITPEDLANGVEVLQRMERLEDFMQTFDSYAKPGETIEIKIAPDGRLLNEIYRSLSRDLTNLSQLDKDVIHVEPLLIMALKALLDTKTRQWALQQERPVAQPRPVKVQDEAPHVEEDPLQTFRQLYNDAVEDPSRRDEFMQNYSPIRFAVVNTEERRRDPNIKPVFETADDGNYYAVEIEGRYAVVPRLDLTFQDSNYGLGAMGQVFDCPNYDSLFQYRNVKIVKPAFFEPDAARQRWQFREKGELNLGEGE